MSLNTFLQKMKLDQTKSYLKAWNICRNEKFTMKSCSTLIDRIECRPFL